MIRQHSQAALAIFAVAPPGLEHLVAQELTRIGIQGTVVQGGVEFTGDLGVVRRANLHSRTATRVLVRLASFKARTFFELERHTAKLDWRAYLSTSKPFALRTTSRKSKLYHEGAIEQRLQKAIRAATGAVPAPRASDEDSEGLDAQLFVVRVLRDEFTISVDSSGALLHMRGYRQAVAKAPLRENLAAALVLLADWTGAGGLLDPLCGSGVIPIEAALIARNIAPALAGADRRPRKFAFESWPIHQRRDWEKDVLHARGLIKAAPAAAIFGSDRDAGAIDAARANAQRAGVADLITFTLAPLRAAPHPPGAVVVTNPPYGMRVSEGTDLRNLYAALGRYMQDHLPDSRLVMLAAEDELVAEVGRMRVLAETRNGGIPVKIFAGGAE